MATDSPSATRALSPPACGPDVSSAEPRARLLLARLVGIGYVCFFLLLLPEIRAQSELVAGWWTPAAVVLLFGPGFVLGVLAFVGDGRWIGVCAGLCAAGYLVGAATWPIAWTGTSLDDGTRLWFSAFPGLASLAAAAVWRVWQVFAHLAVAVAGSLAIDYMAVAQPDGSLLPGIFFGFGYSSLFVATAVMAIRTGRLLDRTRDETHRAAVMAATVRARLTEQKRFDALTHDAVMATLLAASRRLPDVGLAGQARKALGQIDALRTGASGSQDVSAALGRLREVVANIDAAVPMTVHVHADMVEGRLSSDGVDTIGAALAEALRNSLRHAGADVDRVVDIAFDPGLLRVKVIDTGCGFDPDRVAPHRLGLSGSIRGRMRQLPGGSSTIESRPGAGTRVELVWRLSE